MLWLVTHSVCFSGFKVPRLQLLPPPPRPCKDARRRVTCLLLEGSLDMGRHTKRSASLSALFGVAGSLVRFALCLGLGVIVRACGLARPASHKGRAESQRCSKVVRTVLCTRGPSKTRFHPFLRHHNRDFCDGSCATPPTIAPCGRLALGAAHWYASFWSWSRCVMTS